MHTLAYITRKKKSQGVESKILFSAACEKQFLSETSLKKKKKDIDSSLVIALSMNTLLL